MSFKLNSGTMNLEIERFPDGTLKGMLVNPMSKGRDAKIIWNYENDGEIFVLQCIVDTMKTISPDMDIILQMPYIPNARMDRVKEQSEFFTLKSFAKLINNMNFKSVEVCDPHSNVSVALIDRCRTYVQIENIISKICSDAKIDTIVFPDMGATKRYDMSLIGKTLNIIILDKTRDWKTGMICGMRIVSQNQNTNAEKVLIIDDIISKGTTMTKCVEYLTDLGFKDISVYATFLENAFYSSDLTKNNAINRFYSFDTRNGIYMEL